MASVSSETALMFLKTGQTNVVRILIDALKEILEDANLECTPTGIKINCIDNSRSVFVQCELSSFEHYECKQLIYIGINMAKLCKVIKMIGNSETISMWVDENSPLSLNVVYQDREAKKVSHTELNMLDLDAHSYTMPDSIEFQSVITMPSIEFQQIIRNLSSVSDEVEITKVGNQLKFSTAGRPEFHHSISFHGLTFLQNESPDDIIRNVYSLHHMSMFIKCTNLSPFVELYLKNDFCIIVKYTCGSLGSIRFFATPRRSAPLEEDEE